MPKSISSTTDLVEYKIKIIAKKLTQSYHHFVQQVMHHHQVVHIYIKSRGEGLAVLNYIFHSLKKKIRILLNIQIYKQSIFSMSIKESFKNMSKDNPNHFSSNISGIIFKA